MLICEVVYINLSNWPIFYIHILVIILSIVFRHFHQTYMYVYQHKLSQKLKDPNRLEETSKLLTAAVPYYKFVETFIFTS